MKLRYTSRAVNELESALVWYEKQRRGLGLDFLGCVEAALTSIRTNPEIYPICYGNFRRCVVRRFPFSIYFTVEDKRIILHAVFDNRSDPRKLP